MPHTTKRILAIRLSALGDVAMTLTVLYALARQYPQLHIDLLTRPFFAKLLINAPSNLHVVEADFKGRYKGAGGTLRLLKELSSRHYDAVADLHNVIRSWEIDAWMRLHGVPVAMVDKQRSKRRRLLKGRFEPEWPYIERYADVFSRLGYPVKLDFVSIYASGREVVKPHPPVDIPQGAVGIAPFARYLNKTYPPELMEQVVASLSGRGIPVYLFGARGSEAGQLQQWAERYPGVVSLAGKYTLDQELAAMSALAVMVSMDSANQHLASLVGTPVITIWGSTVPRCGFQPYGQPHDLGICLNIDCQPCSIAGSPGCPRGTMECMRGITPQSVVDRIISILHQ